MTPGHSLIVHVEALKTTLKAAGLVPAVLVLGEVFHQPLVDELRKSYRVNADATSACSGSLVVDRCCGLPVIHSENPYACFVGVALPSPSISEVTHG